MMRKKEAEKALTLLKSYVRDMVVECGCECRICDVGWTHAIIVSPGALNERNCLFHVPQIVDFVRGQGLSMWIGAKDEGGYPVPYVYIV